MYKRQVQLGPSPSLTGVFEVERAEVLRGALDLRLRDLRDEWFGEAGVESVDRLRRLPQRLPVERIRGRASVPNLDQDGALGTWSIPVDGVTDYIAVRAQRVDSVEWIVELEREMDVFA